MYVLLLQEGSLSPVAISRTLSLKSSTIYFVLEGLNKKSLVREIKTAENKRPLYQAEEPEALKSLIQKRKIEMEEQLATSSTIIAELATVKKNRGEKPVIQFYEGRSGVSQSIKEYTNTEGFSEEMDYGVYSYDLIDKLFTAQDVHMIEKHRVSKNLTFRALYTGNHEMVGQYKNQEVIKMDQERFPIECDIGIFGDDVRFHILSDAPYGIAIKNPHIATTIKSLIDYIFVLRNELKTK